MAFAFHGNIGPVALDREKLGLIVSDRLRDNEHGALLQKLDDQCCDQKKKDSKLNQELAFSPEFQQSLQPQMLNVARAFLYRSRLSETQLMIA